jgi:hypothetical protein
MPFAIILDVDFFNEFFDFPKIEIVPKAIRNSHYKNEKRNKY